MMKCFPVLSCVLAMGVIACGTENSDGNIVGASGVDGGDVDGGNVDAAIEGGADAGAATDAALPTGKAIITMWCGPPAAHMNKARVDEIAAAGFTHLSNACDNTTYTSTYNHTMLDLARADGMQAIVTDSRVAIDALAGKNIGANLDAVVADYGSHLGLAGYHVTDEPNSSLFPTLTNIVGGLKTRDPSHFAYINLLPDYPNFSRMGVTYDQYLTQFFQGVKPEITSFDQYPFYTSGDSPAFFSLLGQFRAHAISSHVPFFQFIQSISYTGHRSTTGAEKRWEAMQSLAYGAAGVSYFTYWTPPQTLENFGAGIIAANGTVTPQYADVQTINRSITAIGRYLVAATSKLIFHNGELPLGTSTRVPGDPVYVVGGAAFTVGEFTVGNDAYAMLANGSYTATTDSDVEFASADGKPEVLNELAGAFAPMALDAKGRTHISLAPGFGTLVHMRGPIPTGRPGAEAVVGTVRANYGYQYLVDSNFTAQALKPAGWDDCPTGYILGGRSFQTNGFWICLRKDLATKRFYVGNVVSDAGTMYSVLNNAVTATGPAPWDTCPSGAFVAHRFNSNGFWVCRE